jgi:hypothetical protein
MRTVARFIIGLVAVLLLSIDGWGCGGEDPWCRTHRCEPVRSCSATISPTPELQSAAESASRRLAAATGCELRVAPGGVPLVMGSLPGMCGGTRAVVGHESRLIHRVVSIVVDRSESDCADVDSVVLHEAIHLLLDEPGTPQVTEHAASGVFTVHLLDGGVLLDASSLNLLCSHATCSRFVPEQ